jgi:hypothetical protein
VPPLDGASNEPPVDQAEHLGLTRSRTQSPLPARAWRPSSAGAWSAVRSNQHIRFNRPRPDHSWVSGESAR